MVESKDPFASEKTNEATETHLHPAQATEITPIKTATPEDTDEDMSEDTVIDNLLEGDPSRHWADPEKKETPLIELRTTPSEWADTAIGDIVDRTDEDGTQDIIDLTETKKQAVTAWLHSNTAHHYRNISTTHREKIIDHIMRIKYPELHDAEWTKALRLHVWRAVVRANFFWLDPSTQTATGKPKPIVRPAGIFENHFEAFVECASERLDRINKDLPNPEYVKKVEEEVRSFLTKVEYNENIKQLQHLAFLLMFEEEQRKTALGLEDMQERVRRAFQGVDIELEEYEFMRRGPAPTKATHPAHTVAVADAIWADAVFELS